MEIINQTDNVGKITMSAQQHCFINGVEPSRLRFEEILGREHAAFETFLAQASNSNGFKALGLSMHLNRLKQSSLGLFNRHVDQGQIRIALSAALSKLDSECVRARLVVRENDWLLFVDPFVDPWSGLLSEHSGIRCMSVEAQRDRPEIKDCLATTSIRARQVANQNNFEEALLIDAGQQVREGAWSNFFWIDEKSQIYTPASHILLGVTREIVRQSLGVKVIETEIELALLKTSIAAAFITQATRGIVPLRQLDELSFSPAGPAFELIQTLKQRYRDLFTNGRLAESVL